MPLAKYLETRKPHSKLEWQVSKSIIARKFARSDAASVFEVVENNRTYLRQWMPWLDQTTSVANIEQFIQKAQEGYVTGSNLLLGLWDDTQYVGIVSFNEIDGASAEIGYWISQDYQGKGIIRCAVKLLIEHGFQHLNLSTVNIQCAINNLKSHAVAQKLGFTLVKTIPNNEWLYDHYVDHALYVLTQSD